MIIHGDCLAVMQQYPDNHFTSIFTDPPYGLSFMNKAWDHSIPGKEFWIEALRVCKPGAMMLCFGGTRTYHRLTCAIEDAGWEIRDCLMWLYGSGFPKSHNKFGLGGYGTALKPAHEIIIAAQKPLSANTERDIIVENLIKLWCQLCLILPVNVAEKIFESNNLDMNEALNFAQWNVEKKSNIQADLSAQMDILQLEKVLLLCLNTVASWKNILDDHWKNGNMCTTSIKINPIIDLKTLRFFLCQLTLQSIIQEEIKQHGSWLNVLPAARYLNAVVKNINSIHELSVLENAIEKDGINVQTLGLSPAYEPIILAMKPLDGTYAQNVERWGLGGINIDGCRIGTIRRLPASPSKNNNTIGFINKNIKLEDWDPNKGRWPANILFDEEAAEMLGEPKRFFYCAKASSAERNRGCEGLPLKEGGIKNESGRGFSESDPHAKIMMHNNHPTVKPIVLLEYLLKLIAPPKNALILDPFAGSGSTCVAAKQLGVECVGIEISEEYCNIAEARIDSVKPNPQMDLFS